MSAKTKFDLLLTGVGGQGNILASDIIGEVALTAEGSQEMVAHATGTYSIPAKGDDQ